MARLSASTLVTGLGAPTVSARASAASRLSRFIAFALTISVLIYAYSLLSNDNVPDWYGYRVLYEQGGAWLALSGRDPVFTALINLAYTIFGYFGYETFRSALFIAFLIAIFPFFQSSPSQPRLNHIWFLMLLVATVLSATLTKVIIQIREGIGAAVVVAALFVAYRSGNQLLARLMSVMMLVMAAAIHSGLALFAVVGVYCFLFRARIGNGRNSVSAAAISALAGLAVGIILLFRSSDANFLIQDFGTDTQAVSEIGFTRYVYWVIQTVLSVLLVIQISRNDVEGGGFADRIMVILTVVILPFMIGIINALVYGGFQVSAIIALFGRIFFTLCEISLISIILRRQANAVTLLIGLVLLADRLRVIYVSVNPQI